MKRFEAYLIRYEMNLRKLGNHERELDLVKDIHKQFKFFENSPDLTEEDVKQLEEEVRRSLNE